MELEKKIFCIGTRFLFKNVYCTGYYSCYSCSLQHLACRENELIPDVNDKQKAAINLFNNVGNDNFEEL